MFRQIVGLPKFLDTLRKKPWAKTPLDINMWHNPGDRKLFVNELNAKGVVENFEASFAPNPEK